MSTHKNQPLVYAQQLHYLKIFKRWLKPAQYAEIDAHWSWKSPGFLLVFRFIVVIVLAYRWSLENYASFFKILQYLTEFGFNTTLIYFFLICLDFVFHKTTKQKLCPELSTWINLLFQITFCLQFPITIIFWSLIFDYNAQNTNWSILKDFGVHGFPLICLIIDFFFNAFVFRLKHLPIVIGYGVFYMFINLGYSLTVAPVYVPIDWVSFLSYVWIVIALVLVVVVHRGACFIWHKYKFPKIQEQLQPSVNNLATQVCSQLSDLV